jgi:hypothetical protein
MLARRTLIWILLLTFALAGQELRLSTASVSRGNAGSVSITLSAPGGREPAALEWELFFPMQQVSLDDNSWSPGSAANAAGKLLTCVRQLRRQPEAYSYKCVLAGGQRAIRSGVVAVVKFNIPKTAPRGDAVLRLEGILGASPEAGELEMKPARAAIRIR